MSPVWEACLFQAAAYVGMIDEICCSQASSPGWPVYPSLPGFQLPVAPILWQLLLLLTLSSSQDCTLLEYRWASASISIANRSPLSAAGDAWKQWRVPSLDTETKCFHTWTTLVLGNLIVRFLFFFISWEITIVF